MRRALTNRSARPVRANDTVDEAKTEIYYWWLLLAIVLEYARPAAFLPWAVIGKLNTVVPLSLVAVTLVAPGLRSFREIFADRYALWLGAYFGLIALSLPFAAVTLYAFNVFKLTLGYFLLFLVIARVVTSRRRIHGVFVTLLLAHLFLILMTPAIVLNPDVRSYIRGGTFLGDGNDFALSLCVLFPMVIVLARTARSKFSAAIAWAFSLLILVAIIGTQSRGGALSLTAVLGFLWLLSKRKAASLVVIASIGAFVAIVASNTYFTRMSSIKEYQTDDSAQARIRAWKAGARMAVAHPLTGVGAGQFPSALGTARYTRDAGTPGATRWMTAHSIYFLVLGELGLPGIACLLALILGGLRATLSTRRLLLRSTKDPPSADALQAAELLYLLGASFVGFAVAGAFLSAAYYPHIFILTGLSIAARSVATRIMKMGGRSSGAGGFVPEHGRGGRINSTRRRSQSQAHGRGGRRPQ